MSKKTSLLVLGVIGLAFALPTFGKPGGGRPDPGDGGDRGGRNGPPTTPPGQGGTPPGHGGTPPGRDTPPPGHGGPNPGRGHGGPEVPRGQSRVCGNDGPALVGPLGQAGGSHVAHVAFDPAEDAESQAWGRMMYFWVGSTFDFVLNVHKVEPGSEWTLVARAADDSAICLGEATANPGGQLHLADSLELDSHLPEDLDPFAPTPEGEDPAGTALELLPSDAVDCEAGSGTSVEPDVLFSAHDIRFVDVDELTCPE